MFLKKLKIPLVSFIASILVVPTTAYSQVSNDTVFYFKDLASFENPGKEWSNVGDVIINPYAVGSFKKTSGTGIILADAIKNETRLATQKNFGDIELEFDFLLSKGAKSALLLMDHYRLNLSDSWAETNASFNSMGGIGKQSEQDSSGLTGSVPLVNTAKAPGLWQHVQIRFRAPQFINNNKTSNALLEEVYINGCLVQQNIELQAPAAAPIRTNDQHEAPIVFYGSEGVIAIKSFVAHKLKPLPDSPPVARRVRVTNPIIINPERSNYFLRGFLNFKNQKRTHVISVGSPSEVNYSYDLKQGALLQVWNGPFLDVTEMWEQRGEPQLAKPLGSIITLTETPSLAVLPDASAAWPDSVAFEEFRNLGYTLDKARNPAFEYETGGYHVWDKISIVKEGRSLLRQLDVTNAPTYLYCRIALSSAISSLGKGLYVVGDKNYYVQLNENLKPLIRNTPGGVELLVAVTANTPVSYSLIW